MEEKVEVARSRDSEYIQSQVSLLASQGIDYDLDEVDGETVISVAAAERARAEAFFALDERESRAADNTTKRIMPDGVRSIIISMFWFFGLGSLLAIYYGIRGFRKNPFYSLAGILLGLVGIIGAILLFSPGLANLGGPPVHESVPVPQTVTPSFSEWNIYVLAGLVLVYARFYFGRKKRSGEGE